MTLGEVVGSVMAAGFGVQGMRNRVRDLAWFGDAVHRRRVDRHPTVCWADFHRR